MDESPRGCAVIIVPVGWRDWPMDHTGERRLAMRGEQRVAGSWTSDFAPTFRSEPARTPARKMCRYGGIAQVPATATRSPGSNICSERQNETPDEPVVTDDRSG